MDAGSELAAREAQLVAIAEGLSDLPHIRVRLLSASETGRFPLLELLLEEAALGRTASAISMELQRGEPPVHLNERRAAEGILTIHPAGLREGDGQIVVARVRAVLQKSL